MSNEQGNDTAQAFQVGDRVRSRETGHEGTVIAVTTPRKGEVAPPSQYQGNIIQVQIPDGAQFLFFEAEIERATPAASEPAAPAPAQTAQYRASIPCTLGQHHECAGFLIVNEPIQTADDEWPCECPCHQAPTPQPAPAAMILWSCRMTCSACDAVIYDQRGELPHGWDTPTQAENQARIMAEAFAAYRTHSRAYRHVDGGHLTYHERLEPAD